MADIEISIKMPEEYYKSIKDDAKKFLSKGMKVPSLYEIVIKGTPLPKGHGRLIDADELFDKIQFADFSSSDDVNTALFSIGHAPTIIEADIESEDKE